MLNYEEIIAKAQSTFLNGKRGTFAIVRTPENNKLWYAAPGVQSEIPFLRLRFRDSIIDETSFSGIAIIRSNPQKDKVWFAFYDPDKKAPYTTGSVYGKLLVSCLDLPNGVLPQIAIGVLKTFCGDDSVKGELKFKQSFTYYRKPLVMLAGNHPIKVNHAEHEDALFNRMVIVPFADPNVDESERIPNLYQHFLEEAPYIVHEACLAYQDLAARNWVPTRVPIPEEYATKEGNQSLLAVKAFVEDCISFKADSQVTTAELYTVTLSV